MSTVAPTYTFQGVYYNPVFFPAIAGYLTLSQANALFLARTGFASSVASTTSFTGSVVINGLLTLTGGISLTGGLTVDNLTVNTLSTLNTNTIINNILTINATNSIIGQTTFSLVPILPSGYQFLTNTSQTIIGAKTFSSVITSNGINDSISITAPTITASTVCNAPYFNATNATLTSNLYNALVAGVLSTNLITNSSSTLPINIGCGTISIPSGTNASSGLQIGWNGIAGDGETDFINLGQAGAGGFNFGVITNSLPYRGLCLLNPYSNYGLWLFSNTGRLRIDDRNGGAYWWSQSMEGSQMIMGSNGISTSITLGCGDSGGVGATCLSISTGGVSPNVNLNPLSTTTFNVSHPTTSLGNNISTNTTQYATVGYVNSNGGTSLLPSNNIWTGTNSYTKNQISIGSGTQIYVGNSTGNQQSIIIGDPLSLATTTISTNCISVGTLSLRSSTGANNISLGTANFTTLTTGNQNISIGTSNGGGITTGSNNIIIGTSSWTSGNFSNCTVIGNTVPTPTANNSIILGSTTETVYINGSSQLNNSLLFGTTVCSGDVLQINNQTKRFESVYTSGVTNTLTNPLPFMILFTPIAGMSFILPVPSATNAGQTFIIRRAATGGGQSIAFSVTGGGAVWLPVNSGSGVSSFVVSVTWQFTFYSNGTNYICIA